MNNIARIRKARGLRQGDLAEMVGISQPHISRIEGGDEGPLCRFSVRLQTPLTCRSQLFSLTQGRISSRLY
ncbi:helix-turn-helix transcriptional regulator [Paracoccus cavernae]|uniref:helix-turn-helix transcriptional regulator n=1 Tax=Paracoccus cavernae TaxID=1571207 RepID=UPI00362ED7B0